MKNKEQRRQGLFFAISLAALREKIIDILNLMTFPIEFSSKVPRGIRCFFYRIDLAKPIHKPNHHIPNPNNRKSNQPLEIGLNILRIITAMNFGME